MYSKIIASFTTKEREREGERGGEGDGERYTFFFSFLSKSLEGKNSEIRRHVSF